MSRKEFLTPLQEQWALPFELRPSGGSQSLRVSGEGRVRRGGRVHCARELGAALSRVRAPGYTMHGAGG